MPPPPPAPPPAPSSQDPNKIPLNLRRQQRPTQLNNLLRPIQGVKITVVPSLIQEIHFINSGRLYLDSRGGVITGGGSVLDDGNGNMKVAGALSATNSFGLSGATPIGRQTLSGTYSGTLGDLQAVVHSLLGILGSTGFGFIDDTTT